jgi:tRNA (guanosine-2'-O-)-methyltransferase
MDAELQQYLEGFLSPGRMERFRQVLQQRTRYATVVLEDIYQSQNASAVLRTAECLGLQDIYVIENKHRYEVNKQVVRGASKWIDVHRYAKHENNTLACINQLKEKGYRIAVTKPGNSSTQLTQLDVETPTAFVLGTEKYGVSQEAQALSDVQLTIPMYGFTESYNVSVSAALCIFQFMNETKKQDMRWRLSESEQNEILHRWTRLAIRKSKLIVQEFYTNTRGKK